MLKAVLLKVHFVFNNDLLIPRNNYVFSELIEILLISELRKLRQVISVQKHFNLG